MRIQMTFLCCIALAACKPSINTEFYSSDIIEVAETGEAAFVPVKVGFPIMSASSCDEDRTKIMPAIERHGEGVKFIGCEVLSGSAHDILNVEMNAEILRAGNVNDIVPKGLFGIVVIPTKERIDVHFVKTPAAARAVAEIDRNYAFQNVTLDEINISVRLNNDSREPVTFEVSSSFVNTAPIDEPQVFQLARRDALTVVPSDVRAKALLKNGSAMFASVITSD